jgi:predicted O-methyltransferase YrrM
MYDYKSSLSVNLPRLTLNLLKRGIGKETMRRVAREIKAEAGHIRTIPLTDIPGWTELHVTGDLTSSHLVAGVAKANNVRSVFEFGTYLGLTSMSIAENCPETRIVTLDLPDDLAGDFVQARTASSVEITDSYLFTQQRGCRIRGEPANRIRQIREDSAKFDPEPFRAQFDFIYIDASHSYSAVKSDTEKAFIMLQPGGTMLWDDYCYPGIWRYLNELAAANPNMHLRYLRDWDKVILLPERTKQ